MFARLVVGVASFVAVVDGGIVAEINAQYSAGRSLWTAREYDWLNAPGFEIEDMFGVVSIPTLNLAQVAAETATKTTTTPTSFDWREIQPECVHPIRDQGKCGSCWANAASEVLSDRFCIHSNASVNVVLSPL